ncbi:MAG: ATP-binding protein [Flavihumibacter sp.]
MFGILLFAKDPAKFIPQSKIRVLVYPGKSVGNNLINDLIYDGNIFKNIHKIWGFLENFFGKSIKIENLQRTEKSNYPVLAFREAVLNAIIHRDYSSLNSFLIISIFKDRTEITNYGNLPEGIGLKDLKTEHVSVLRNPDIAYVCFIRKYIEMIGSGTLRMIADAKRHGFKTPAWKEKNNLLTVRFAGIGHSEGVNEGVNKELASLLSYIEEDPDKKAGELSKMLGKSLATTERYLKILKEQGHIEFAGAPKTGGYRLKK